MSVHFRTHHTVRVGVASLAIAAAVALVNVPALAQQGSQTAAQPTAQVWAGEVNTDSVMLLSSARADSSYAVTKLNKGQMLRVIERAGPTLLKVAPTDDTYCLVQKRLIEKRGDGKVGRVTGRAIVRIGSNIVDARSDVSEQQLEAGDEVRIIGEEGEFYKIAPPAWQFFYVNRQFVNPVRQIQEAAIPTNIPSPGASNQNSTSTTPETGSTTTASVPFVVVPPTNNNATNNSSTNNSDGSNLPRFTVTSEDAAAGPDAAPTTTTPTNAAPTLTDAQRNQIRTAQDRLNALEARYTEVSEKPLLEQEVDALLGDYQALLDNESTPPNAKRVAEFRVENLKLRQEAIAQAKEVERLRLEMAQKDQEITTERTEIEQRVADAGVKQFAAIGKLAFSSLQSGGETLYRLIDPKTNRTMIYVRSNDPAVAEVVGQFVGLYGQPFSDDAMRLKFIKPEKIELLDPAQVNVSAFAPITPPSMVTATLSAQPQE